MKEQSHNNYPNYLLSLGTNGGKFQKQKNQVLKIYTVSLIVKICLMETGAVSDRTCSD